MNGGSIGNTSADKKPDLKTISRTSPPSMATAILSDSLFPPRKPKPKNTTHDTGNYKNNDHDDDSDGDTAVSKKDPLSAQTWRLYTNAKDTLPNGSRLENLTWRMMAMTLKKKEAAEKAKQEQQGRQTRHSGNSKMDTDMLDTSYQEGNDNKPGSPPAPDDTTTMLSSSAPPYMIDFLGGGPPFQRSPPPRQKPSKPNKNVLVYGSARASSPSPTSLSPSSYNGYGNDSSNNAYCSQPPGGLNSITIPVDLPTDSDMDEDTEEDFRMSFQSSFFIPHGDMTYSNLTIPTNQHQSHVFDSFQHHDHQPALFPRLGYADLQSNPDSSFSHEQQQQSLSPPPLPPSLSSSETASNPGSLSFEALLHMYTRQPQLKLNNSNGNDVSTTPHTV
ncbi:hypothetical protein BCR42DRAFT_144517 [Absidia repens]|uniref:Nitrogen regulatory protein areA GATA-like domain-containing protein n=1 Tax=Absidia repens TaxID=90262 RepID=A0A1X2I3G2_9FUNG|nr:hypothetical protein BCR42DRAFT_144517 [Absidia repens]